MYGVIAQVLYVDEYHTSKLCPSCQSEVTHLHFTSVQDASKKQKSTRRKTPQLGSKAAAKTPGARREKKSINRGKYNAHDPSRSTLSFFFFPPCHVSIRPRFHQYVQLACTSAETPRDEDPTAAPAALATFSVASCQNLTAIHHTGATFSPIQIHPRSTYSSTHQHVNSHVQLQKRREMKMPPLPPPRSPPFP